MSQRSKQKAASFENISKIASKLVRKKGLKATSVQGVMRGAGLTVGAFYAHFKDKDEMVKMGLNLAMADVATLVEEAAQGKTGEGALVSVAKRYLSMEHRDDPETGCPLPSALGSAVCDSASGKLRRILAGAVETMTKRLSKVSNGEVSERTVLAVLAIIVGAQVIARATKDSKISDKVLMECSNFLDSFFKDE